MLYKSQRAQYCHQGISVDGGYTQF